MHQGIQQISNFNSVDQIQRKPYGLPFLFLSLLLLIVPALVSCETYTKKQSRPEEDLNRPFQQEFIASFESVWRAAQISVRYPISLNNMDTGQLETDWIRALEGFTAPDQKKIPSSGIRYKIILTMVRGKKNNRPSVRVTLRKIIERQRDFFSEPEPIVTDGLEEKVILYRMERELIIQEGLKKIPDPK